MAALNDFSVERVDLFLSAQDLPKLQTFSQTDPFAVVLIKDGKTQGLTVVGQTPIIKDNPNPNWSKPITCNYMFEVDQTVVVKVYHWDGSSSADQLDKHKLIGEVTFRLSSLMRSPESRLSFKEFSSSGGTLSINGESQVNTRDLFCVTFSGTKLANKDGFFGTSDPFVVMSRMNEDGSHTAVWKSNKIDNTLNPHWAPAKISITQLCNGDMFRPLKIEIFDWDSNGKHDTMGEVETSVNDLLNSSGRPMPVIEPEKKKKKGASYSNSGHLAAKNASIEHRPTFSDFISHGLELNMIVAIDFTGSNGDPSLPNSLHYIDPTTNPLQGQNPYQRCIKAVGRVLEAYDTDRAYPVYGFGARLRAADDSFGPAQHCFPVYSGGAQVQGVDGILEAYSDCLSRVQLSGPTLFQPLIEASGQFAAQSQCSQTNQKYTVVLIITDGTINDMAATKAAICHVAQQPLSFIIVGVGNADFSGMEELDSDDKTLSAGKATAGRDIVQFVAFKDQEMPVLAAQVLAEIPNQVLQYMHANNITPNKG